MTNLLEKYSNRKSVRNGMNMLLGGTILSPVIIPAFMQLNNKTLECIANTSVAQSTQPSLIGMTIAYFTVFCGGAASMILAAGEEKNEK
ncbi:hypothetical protein U729_3246 (plasmid) [Clostridium baratii str. Sullivan]|uniref:Uncharacterized protein n=1 Tax=Clostridium baratii str. Sullivan TaxID=1415775 RepID=A0A0A7G344_9CLOT|nr:hypothetical protein [Clostridium baratii]AIY85401.1 hypothetical protein U729_3246 [Clostridium baratii str. Sullivan]